MSLRSVSCISLINIVLSGIYEEIIKTCFKLRLGQEHLNLGGNYALNFYCIALIAFLFCVCIGKYRYSWV